VMVGGDGEQEAMHRNACMVLVALTEDADGRKVMCDDTNFDIVPLCVS
jgi:hypothetical protein